MELLDNLYCHAINKYEDFTHWYWNKSPHRVRCIICGDTMRSADNKYSPEECGWRSIKFGNTWVCHKCDAHRNLKPYIKLADIDEEIGWAKLGASNKTLEELKYEKKRILMEMVLEEMTKKEDKKK